MKYFPLALLLLGLLACQGGPRERANALIHERSPYLQQHAYNPVDWQPWGEAALEKARREDKMLIVSVGYAACHWCHVMEKESFSDPEVARLMNEHFIAIKVDREERPDVDGVYMAACQLAGERACGWPLNAFALPDGRPVWAGTYSPRKQWLEILEYFVQAYQNDRVPMERYAAQLSAGLQAANRPQPPLAPAAFAAAQLSNIAEAFFDNLDLQRGGRKGAPKFPMPNAYEFLLQYHRLSGHPTALQAVTVTLGQLAGSGLYDQLGGGFARYATDADWRVPHFEKMLYDNAQLVSLYSKAYQATGEERYRQVAIETLAFVERELTSPEGGFYSSLDADSEGEEGRFYTWQKAEIDSILGDARRSALFCAYFSVEAGGNWEGRNILYRSKNGEKILTEYKITPNELTIQIEAARQQLFAARAQRPRPALDHKVLTAWNALMIQGYLDAYRAFGEPAYLAAAERNAHFLMEQMMKKDGRLERAWAEGRAGINAFLDDYAFCIQAFVSLYECTFEEAWLGRAEKLADYALAHFLDVESGFFYYTSALDPPLAARRMELEDNVIPASNSALARALFHLGHLLYRTDFTERAEALLQAMAPRLEASVEPNFFSNWCALYAELAYPFYEIAVVGPDAAALAAELRRHYLPNALLLGGQAEGSLPLLKGKLQAGETYIYVCLDKVCKWPVKAVEEIEMPGIHR
jgi:uncharacterized protein